MVFGLFVQSGVRLFGVQVWVKGAVAEAFIERRAAYADINCCGSICLINAAGKVTTMKVFMLQGYLALA